MLAIRMQRTGRKGHAMFRVVVQDSRRTPTSGKVAAYLGSYDPHKKIATLAKDKVVFYLDHGAQPSERVAKLLTSEGVKLPAWVSPAKVQARTIRHPEKLRRNQPKDAKSVESPEASEPVAEPSEPVVEISEATTEPGVAAVESAEPAAEAAPEVETALAETPADDAPVVEAAPTETPAEAAELPEKTE
jgi:small subunit ribosomal protein S16